MKKNTAIWILVVCLIVPVAAQEKTEKFDGQAALNIIKDLATDAMEGRRSGQPGGTMGEEYIAAKFKEWGLEPAGDNDTYFQNFTIEHRHVAEGVVFEVITPRERRVFDYGEEWRVQSYSGSGLFTAEMVFVGYGIHAPEKKYDDYEGVNLKGKLALMSSASSEKLGKLVGDAAEMDSRVAAAQKLGARGVIMFRPATRGTQPRFFRMRLEKEIYRPDFVILSVEEDVENFIFKDLPTETRRLFQDIDFSTKPQSFATGVKIFLSINSIFDEKRPTRNVLAKITGSDPGLREESIVIGAHMDHLGITPLGEVMNGANDNASGTAVTMELARVMKLSGRHPKRTVIFALWSGEEQGLLGSRHYADHPAYPIEKTIANINMDMVGHGEGKVPFNGIYYGPQIWEVLESKLPKEMLETITPRRGGPGGSDHTPFLEKGVPGFFIITQGAIKYHQSRDDSDLINPEMLQKTGDFVLGAVDTLASEPGDFLPALRQETYQLKSQDLINHELSTMAHVLEAHGEAKDSHVDLQLALIEENNELAGDALRLDILESLLDLPEKVKKAKGLSLFSSSSRWTMDIRQGKTTVMAGLGGLRAFADDPKWAAVLAKQGVGFVVIDDPSLLFGEKGLSEEGQAVIKGLNDAGLLAMVSGATAEQAKTLLDKSKRPLILLGEEVPPQEILDLVKEKEWAVGLLLKADAQPDVYFKKVDAVKKAIGTNHLILVNEQCLWEEAGKTQMLRVIGKILKADYDRSDLRNVFSGTFLRVLEKAKGEAPEQPVPYIPF